MEKQNFIGRDNWKTSFPIDDSNLDIIKDKNVIVLRSLLFFYKGEKTSLSIIRNHFTEHAINKLVHYEFIKIEE